MPSDTCGLASGTTELRVNEFGTLLHAGPCQVIIPAAYLVELGFVIAWKRKGCRIKHAKPGLLDVTVVKGCPLIPNEVGLELLREYEARQAQTPKVKSLEVPGGLDLVPRGQVRGWFRQRLGERDGLTRWEQQVYLRSLFPGLLPEVVSRACVDLDPVVTPDWSSFPWNRRLRRSLNRAAPRSVLLNCSAKKPGWKGLGRVLTIENDNGGLCSDLVFGQLLKWAKSGVVGGVVWGSAGVDFEFKNGGEEEVGVGILRMFLLFGVAQAVEDASVGIGAVGSKHQEEEAGVLPDDLLDPAQIAVWALKKAANRLKNSATPQAGLEGTDSPKGSPIFLVVQVPPTCGSSSGKDTEERWSQALLAWQGIYELNRARFDQGCFGAPDVRATELVTSSWLLFEALQGYRVPEGWANYLELLNVFQGGTNEHEGWAMPLIRVIQKSWVKWKTELGNLDEVSERKGLLKRLCSKEEYALHVANDHSPYLKGVSGVYPGPGQATLSLAILFSSSPLGFF